MVGLITEYLSLEIEFGLLERVFVLKLDILYFICCILLFQNVNLLVLFLKKEQFIQKGKQKGHVEK